MRILALMGSPRKEGNTDILMDQFLKGARKKAIKVDKLYLYDLELTPCVDCRVCKSGDLICKVKDDMQKIYSLMDAADIIVFGTPVYWWGPTATMKLLIDRLRPYGANQKLKGKKAVLIAPSGDSPSTCQIVIEQFGSIFNSLGLKHSGTISVQAFEKGEVAHNLLALKKAYDLGAYA